MRIGLDFYDNQGVPFMHSQLPFHFQAGTSESMTYMNQASCEGMSQSQQVQSLMFQANSNAIRFSPLRLRQRIENFEPDYNDCDLKDDFANFIEGAIHQVE